MTESENLAEAINGIAGLKPFKQGWVLWIKGEGYFKDLPLFAMNPHGLCKSAKDAKHFETEDAANRFKNMLMHSGELYQAVKRTIQ